MIEKPVSAEAPAPDIVKRLRQGYPCKEAAADGCCKVMDARSGCLCAEAADTITRLTAEVERLTTHKAACGDCCGISATEYDGTVSGFLALTAENERLRAALDITTEGLEWCVIRAEAMPTPDVDAGRFARVCLDKARAALKDPRT